VASPEFSDDDLREMHALLQAAALKAYPNPERIGCPGNPTLEEIAKTPNPSDHPVYDHVATCSPCLGEMLELRKRRVLALAAWRRRRLALIVGAAAALIISILSFYLIQGHQKRPRHLRPVETAFDDRAIPEDEVGRLDFSNTSAERGASSDRPKAQSVRSNVRELVIDLPVGSELGRYDLEIRNAVTLKSEVEASRTKVLPGQGGNLVLKALVDLSKLSAGQHIAAWRQAHQSTWDFGAFVIQ
jgi:hypothetical protein